MEGYPTFKLDLLSFTNLAGHLPYPLPTEPTDSSCAVSTVVSEQQIAQDPQILQALYTTLANTDIQHLHSVQDARPCPNPSSLIAQHLLQHDPRLFSYELADYQPLQGYTTPAAAVGLDDHNVNYTHPDVGMQGAKATARPKSGEKRRRRAGDQDVAFSKDTDPAAAAERLAAQLDEMLSATEQPVEDSLEAQPLGDDGDLASGTAGRLNSTMLKQLHDSLLKAKLSGYMHLIPAGTLKAVLTALQAQVQAGQNQLLLEELEAEEFQTQHSKVITAVEAAVNCLYILSCPDLAPEVYIEEVMEKVVDLVKYQLQYNLLVFYDVRFRRLYRPSSLEDGEPNVDDADRGKHGKGSKTPKGKPGQHIPRFAPELLGRVEECVNLLREVLGVVRMESERLLPLVRTLLQALTVDGIAAFQVKATGLTVAVFKHYSQQRHAIMDEFTSSVMSYLHPGSKHIPRHYLAQEQPALHIQMCVSLVMQLIQSVAELPSADDTDKLEALMAPYNTCVGWVEKFWTRIFERLPTAKATKSDTAMDLKMFVEQFLVDLLNVQLLPEWPAASLLLRIFVVMLNGERGLKHTDSNVRLMCIDFLGQVTLRVCQEAVQADKERDYVQQGLSSTTGSAAGSQEPFSSETAVQLVISYLSGNARMLPPAAAIAKHVIVCKMLYDKATEIKKALKATEGEGADIQPDEASALVVHYRQLGDAQATGACSVDAATACQLNRWILMDSGLGKHRPMLLRWLADAGGRSKQESTAALPRAKAIKALGGILEVDIRVLGMAEVQEGVKGALMDDAVSVREAAVDLVGKYISREQNLAEQYYDVIAKASNDGGITVRKRAVKILWECCVRSPNFKYAGDAVVKILVRASDQEESMRSLVSKMCSGLWFTPDIMIEDVSSDTSQRSLAVRCRNLAEVCGLLYEQGGNTIHVPWPKDMPMIAAIAAIVGQAGKKEYDAARKGASEVAQGLLSRLLQLADAADRAEADRESFQCLLALHALCEADVLLCLDPKEQDKYVRSLAPYLKSAWPSANADDRARRRASETLVCILAIFTQFFSLGLRHLDGVLASEVARDLGNIIYRHAYVQVVDAACHCLCALASLKPECAKEVMDQSKRHYNVLFFDLGKGIIATSSNRKLYPRFLYAVGCLCRYGSHIMEIQAQKEANPALAVTAESSLTLLLKYYNLQDVDERVKENALQAMGFLFVPRPDLLLDNPDSLPVLQSCLRPEAASWAKLRALGLLADLLQADEAALKAKQAEASKDQASANQASTMPAAHQCRALARRNGEGDTSSVTSGVLQQLWDEVLQLATDTGDRQQPGPTTPPTPSTQTFASAASVRRRALDCIEVVLRGGIVLPWTAAPALLALCTDPNADISAKALKLLKQSTDAHSQYVVNYLGPGVMEAWQFHRRLQHASGQQQQSNPMEAVNSLWQHVIQPDKTMKPKFLQQLLKSFDEAATMSIQKEAVSTETLLFLAQVIAELQYKRMDEPLSVMVSINSIISKRADSIYQRFQDLVKAEKLTAAAAAAQATPGQQMATCASSDTPVHNGHATSAAGATPATAALAGGSMPPPKSLPPASSAQASVPGVAAVCLLLYLKMFLRTAYDLSSERVQRFAEPSSTTRKQEERTNAIRKPMKYTVPFASLLAAPGNDPSRRLKTHSELYKSLKHLLTKDAEEENRANASRVAEDEQVEAAEDAGATQTQPSADEAMPHIDAALAVPSHTKTRSTATRGRKAGPASGTVTKSKGRGRKRSTRFDSDDEGDDQDDDNYEAPSKKSKAKKKLDLD